jgi:hypothetical protein
MRAVGQDSYRRRMTTSTRSSMIAPRRLRLRTEGPVGAIASAVGAAPVAWLMFRSPMVAPDRSSYPSDASWFRLAGLLQIVTGTGEDQL